MTDNPLTLHCLVGGEATSNALLVEIPSSDTVDDLKNPIETKETNDSVVPANKHKPIVLNEIDSTTELDPTDDNSDVFPKAPPKETIDDTVQRLLRTRARDSTPPLSGHLSGESTLKSPPGSSRQAREAFNTSLERLERDVFHADTSISRFLHSFVKGDLSIPDANCCVKGLPKSWCRSRSYCAATPWPALDLLHPKRPHRTTKTPPSEAALKMIMEY
ncbi:hypothetical protein BGX30_011486 [Mortierella sp. GBA39]|nr:hypothetical protein BGX30_011486 [Mortierella sp. GBA39]